MSGKPPLFGEATSSAAANPPGVASPATSASGQQDAAAQPLPSDPPAPPSVSLQTGGGAIRGIGEKFSVTAATGTAGLSVPVATSPGRSGFGPSLTLRYDSGAGNGAFGLGWELSALAITRKTDKGLPRYADDPDTDTFLLTGADDLVPFRTERDGRWEQALQRRHLAGREYIVQCYRPRIEGLFSRIERWRDRSSGETHWRTITSGNVTTLYGTTANSRIADPADPERVFSWLICASYDDTGNAAVYDYLAEDSAGIDIARPSERNRTGQSRSANRYLKRVRYGNREPWRAGTHASHSRQGRGEADPGRDPAGCSRSSSTTAITMPPTRGQPLPRLGPGRPDPFSTYRAGFEVRTYRRCHRVLMFHHFPDEPGRRRRLPGLLDRPGLHRNRQRRYDHARRRSRTPATGASRTAATTASRCRRSSSATASPVIGHEVRDLDPRPLENLPAGIERSGLPVGGPRRRRALRRPGPSGRRLVLQGQPRRRAVRARADAGDTARHGSTRRSDSNCSTWPATATWTWPNWAGRCPASTSGPADATGDPFRPFRSWPNITWDDPNLRLVDLDGDGLADVLITSDDAFTWYPSLRRRRLRRQPGAPPAVG